MEEVTLIGSAPVTVALKGSIDSANAEEFYAAVKMYYGDAETDLVLDCAALEFLDSTALGTFIKLLKFLKERGHMLKIKGLNPRIKKLFVICALDKIMEIE